MNKIKLEQELIFSLSPKLFHEEIPESWSHVISRFVNPRWRGTLCFNGQLLNDSWAWVTKYIVGNTDSTFVLAHTGLESQQPWYYNFCVWWIFEGKCRLTHFSFVHIYICISYITAWTWKENRALLQRSYKGQTQPLKEHKREPDTQ
jgi:hypothetical protein